MKRINSKLLISAAIFSAAMNMNGCGAYGPPQDRVVQSSYIQTTDEQTEIPETEQQTEEQEYQKQTNGQRNQKYRK